MANHSKELNDTLIKIHKDLLDLEDSNFQIKLENINNRIHFLKNFKEKAKNEVSNEVFREIEEDLNPMIKLISDSFDNIVDDITAESNKLLVEIKIVENKKKINSYRSYDEY